MSLHPQPFDTIPEETKRVAHAAFPKGNLYLTLRDTLSPFYKDEDFASLFSPYGQPAETPWRLALVCIFQFLENLPDRQAAEAVRSRIDWKYVLSLPLDDSGFHFSVLGKFRARLLAGSAETHLLDLLLEHLKAQKLLKARGQQRTDSTHIIAAICSLNRLECVGETLRAALNALATYAPDWLSSIAPSEWFDRYSTRIEESRLPKGEEARREYGNLLAADGSCLLTALFEDPSLPVLRALPAVKNLQRTWLYQYYVEEGHLQWRQAKDLPPAGMRFDSPYDPEARYGNKRSMSWTGYKVHLTETCEEGEPHLITHVETTLAMITDSELVVPIHEALSTKQMLPNQHFMDAGYTDAELFATSQPDYGVDVVGPIRSNGSWQAKAEQGFDLSSFLINWDTKTVTCPQGQTGRHWIAERTAWKQEVIEVSFAKKDCLSCPQRALCTKAKTDPRTLTLRPKLQHEALQAARKRQDTAEFRQLYAKRAGIEGTLSQGIRGFGLRHCRYIGLSKAHLQHIFTAIAMNVARSAAWVEGVPQAKTRTSRFAALRVCGA